MTKTETLAALAAFVARRPGFDPANYAGAPEAYRADVRAATRQLNDARALIRRVELSSIDAEAIIAAKHHRLDITEAGGVVYVEHTTCQYHPVEFRATACASLAAALWNYYRDHCGGTSRERILSIARRELGGAIVRRWFN